MSIINYKLEAKPMAGYSEGGASLTKKTLKTWQPLHLSARSDIDANLNLLRNRSASLAINSPIGQAAIKTSLTGTINSGLKLYPRIKAEELGLSEEEGRAWTRKVKLEFELWAKSISCDFYRRNNFYEMQQIAYQNSLMDGDCFCLFRRRLPTEENPYTLKLQLIEAGRVSNPNEAGFSGLEARGETKGSRIVNGIEVNREGRMEAIWISNRLWNEPSINGELYWQRVKVYGETGQNVLHICRDSRIEQFRGEPYLSPVIETLKQISRFTEAELTSAINKAFFSMFFTQTLGNLTNNQILGASDEPCLDVDEYRVENGMMVALPAGIDVKSIDNSSSQNTFAFDKFINNLIGQIAAGINLPSELLLKKFQSSYSASKAALLQAEEEFRQRREAFIIDFCTPVYENFLMEAIASGRIEAEGYFENPLKRMLWSRADWLVEGNHYLDPVKEIQAAEKRIALGISTRQKETAELVGGDFYEIIEQLKYENEIMKGMLANE